MDNVLCVEGERQKCPTWAWEVPATVTLETLAHPNAGKPFEAESNPKRNTTAGIDEIRHTLVY